MNAVVSTAETIDFHISICFLSNNKERQAGCFGGRFHEYRKLTKSTKSTQPKFEYFFQQYPLGHFLENIFGYIFLAFGPMFV